MIGNPGVEFMSGTGKIAGNIVDQTNHYASENVLTYINEIKDTIHAHYGRI